MSHRQGEWSRVEHLATDEEPFHFLDSGLPNVYLVGVKYFACEDGSLVAEIPALKQLMRLIARSLVETPESLTGAEIRFLRKRLGKKAVDFAKDIGVKPETLSRFESGRQMPGESVDKLIRFIYAVLSDDPEVVVEARATIHSVLAEWKKVRSKKEKIVKKIDNNEWSDVPLAA